MPKEHKIHIQCSEDLRNAIIRYSHHSPEEKSVMMEPGVRFFSQMSIEQARRFVINTWIGCLREEGQTITRRQIDEGILGISIETRDITWREAADSWMLNSNLPDGLFHLYRHIMEKWDLRQEMTGRKRE